MPCCFEVMRRGQTLLPAASPPATTAHLPSRFPHQTGFLFPIFHRFHARFRPHLAPPLPAAHPKSRSHWKHLPFRRNLFHFYSNCFEFFQIQRHGSPPAMAVCALHFSKAHTPLQIPVLLSLHIYSNLIPCCIPPVSIILFRKYGLRHHQVPDRYTPLRLIHDPNVLHRSEYQDVLPEVALRLPVLQ